MEENSQYYSLFFLAGKLVEFKLNYLFYNLNALVV